MECDVAVLGAGPGGYPAAIRAAQLGAKVVCIESEEALGGVCLRVGCIPTKTWVQTARAIKEIEESYANLGIRINEASLDFERANVWKARTVERLTGGVATLFKAAGIEWVKGLRPLHGPAHDRRRRRRGDLVYERDRGDRLASDRSSDSGHRLCALRRFDRPARA